VEEPAPSDNLPWVEKYRPKELTDLISHQQILDTITKLINGGKTLTFYSMDHLALERRQQFSPSPENSTERITAR